MKKIRKKQDVKYPDYWDGNIYICGSIFIYGSDNFYCSLPWNLREKVYTISIEISGKTTWNNVKR